MIQAPTGCSGAAAGTASDAASSASEAAALNKDDDGGGGCGDGFPTGARMLRFEMGTE